MENAINKRVIEILKYFNLSGNEFAKRIRIPQTTFSNIINRDSDIKASIIESIANQFEDISIEWLITGKGEMLLSDENKPKEENKQAIMPSEMLESLYNELRDEKKKLLSIIENQQDIIKKQSETVLSQQRTIEKLADLQKGIAEGARGVVSKAAHG